MTNQRRGPGRPSMGPRRTIAVAMPVELADKVERIRDITGTPMGQIVLGVLQRHVDEIDSDALEHGADQPRMVFDEHKKTA